MKTLCISALLAITSVTMGAQAVSSAEFYTSQSYTYGRFEARIRFAPGDGVVSSFFLWKNGSETAGTFWNELDFEKLGADCHLQTNAIYGNPSAGHTGTPALTANLCDEFHTYGYEWTPDYIAWQVDGVEIRRETGDTALAFAQNATAGMQFRFNVWPGDASFGGNFDPSILPVYEYVNWAQFSSYSNGSFSPSWRQDFSTGAIPSGWLSGNWSSPKNLSTHSPQNVGFGNGNLILALTADGALGTAGAVAVDPNDASGTGGAGNTSDAGAGQSTGGTSAATSSSANTTGDDGCGCRVPQRSSTGTSALAWVGLLAGAALRYRRRHSPRS